EGLGQLTVEMLAEDTSESPLTERLALDRLVFFRWPVAIIELGNRQPPHAHARFHLLLGERDLGPLARPERAAGMLLDVALGILLDLIGRAAQFTVTDIEHAPIVDLE